MSRVLRYGMQLVTGLLFAGLIGYFSDSPPYVYHNAEMALVKLSFSHASQRTVECRRRSAEELAQLAPNMRTTMDCPRQRVVARVELYLDEKLLFAGDMPPGGIAEDGAGSVYQRFVVPAGKHRVTARLRDSARAEGFDYEGSKLVELRPRQNFVVDFRAETGGFQFF